MNKGDLTQRVRSNVNDTKGSVFKEDDILSYLNEGIDRIKQVINELSSIEYLVDREDKPLPLPEPYHHLLAVYATSRCFAQDERHYQSTTLMNEFEYKVAELYTSIINGDLVIVDEYGDEMYSSSKPEYVIDNYFNRKNYDKDEGVVM